jgi:hypothetical protein
VRKTFKKIFVNHFKKFHSSNKKKLSIAKVENVVRAHKNQVTTSDFI